MTPNTLTAASGVLAFLLISITACGDGGDAVVKREGEPDYRRPKETAVMDRAVARAKETYRDFITALASPKAGHTGHAIKKPFKTPQGGEEHIWINEVKWDGVYFTGAVNNEPVETTEVKLGDRVTVRPEELSDWMYLDGKRVIGGYTLRVLHYEQPAEEQRKFVDQTGLIIPPVDF